MSLPCCSESLHVGGEWVAGWGLLCVLRSLSLFASHSPFSLGTAAQRALVSPWSGLPLSFSYCRRHPQSRAPLEDTGVACFLVPELE